MLSKLEAAQVAVFGNLVTVISIFAGIIILNEQFKWFHVVGSVLILAGVWGTNRYKAKVVAAKA
jgi:drug/metabolite transporter (DMT)-like permease